jgi:preprotein translocase subunit SecE
MANRKRKKTNKKNTQATPTASQKRSLDEGSVSLREDEAAFGHDLAAEAGSSGRSSDFSTKTDVAKESSFGNKASLKDKDASKGKDKDKGKDKSKDKTVVKSKARAKDPKKADKKPNIFQRLVEYIKQVRLEIKRTTWPTRGEVLNMTIIVIVALVFFGVLIFILDFVMVELLNLYGSFAPDTATIDTPIDLSAADVGAGDTGVAPDASGADATADAAADAGAADLGTGSDAGAEQDSAANTANATPESGE